MQTIICIQHKKGEFKGFPYDNYIFTTQEESNQTVDFVGIRIQTYKVKATLLDDKYKSDLKQLIGKTPIVWFDQFANVSHIDFDK